jgi:Smg protein
MFTRSVLTNIIKANVQRRGGRPLQRVIGIIQKLIAKVIDTDEESISGPELVAVLMAEGYDSDEIEQALALIFSLPDMIQAGTREVSYPAWSNSMRVFTPEERVKLDLEAQGYLLGLVGAKLLDQLELENVLEEAVALQTSDVGISELQWIVGRVVEDDIRSFLLSTAPVASSDEKASNWWN